MNLIDIIEQGLKMPFTFFLNPEKRVHLLYLFTSLLMAFYIYKRTKVKTSFWSFVIPAKNWFGNSAIVDYAFLFFNSFVKIILIGPYLILGLYIAYYTNEFLITNFGEFNWNISIITIIIVYTFALTLVNDLFSFLTHFMFHKIPFLWEFHKIHHSATKLNPLTQYRLHPVELIVNNARSLLIFGLITGLFDYLSTERIDKLTFVGVNVFSLLFLIFGSNLRHSHIKFTYHNIVEYMFISPFQHQIHHSNNPEHFNKNMGSKLAVWDWLFGTLVRSKQVGEITYGLGDDDDNYNSFWKNLYKPFTNISIKIKRLILHLF